MAAHHTGAGRGASLLLGLAKDGKAPAIIGMIVGPLVGVFIFESVGAALFLLFVGGTVGYAINSLNEKAEEARKWEEMREAKAKKPD
jgi:hypothetical protein